MHAIYNLKEMLCDELEEYGKKGELTTGSLDTVDKLAHAIKNIDKIIEKYEDDEYSGNTSMYHDDMSMRGGRSYARKRDSMGRYSSRGYSRDGDMIAELHELMKDAPDDRTRKEIQKLITKMENM